MKQRFIAEGMSCESCEHIIKKQARKIEGVSDITLDWRTGEGIISYDPDTTDIPSIFSKIEEKGYSISKQQGKKKYWWIPITLGAVLIFFFASRISETINLPSITPGMGYALLFLVGLLTGFHCISMCGGFVVSYTARDAKKGKPSYLSHVLYGTGKTISYTLIGAMFGLFGAFIAFTPNMRGAAGIAAGIFLILYGLKMLHIIPGLRRFGIRLPQSINARVRRIKHSSPLAIGLLNGLMIACGPLQAIYIMAAGTGSITEGAKTLFFFGIGTLPAILGFGIFASYISGKASAKLLKASGAIIILLGALMLSNGLNLTGFSPGNLIGKVTAEQGFTQSENHPGYQEIRMEVTARGWNPNSFTLQKGVPVRWIIDGKEITGCNNAIQVPALGLEFPVQPGIQVIEFTPDKEGIIRWSCWMGMIPGRFIVSSQAGIENPEQISQEILVEPTDLISCDGSCGTGCGGTCGCAGKAQGSCGGMNGDSISCG